VQAHVPGLAHAQPGAPGEGGGDESGNTAAKKDALKGFGFS
jgi:hypothetical protein